MFLMDPMILSTASIPVVLGEGDPELDGGKLDVEGGDHLHLGVD